MTNAKEVRKILDEGGFKLNPYAQAYVDALEESERQYGEDGVKCQIAYIISNIRGKGEKQKTAKKALQKAMKK